MIRLFAHRRTLRRHLMMLVVIVLLPVTVFTAVVVRNLASSHQAEVDRRLTQSARELAGALDREFLATFRTLDALAQSERLERGDLASFHAEAARVAKTQYGWNGVILLSPDGNRLLDTSAPFGTELGLAVEMQSLREIVAARKPTVGRLARGTDGVLGFPVRVPVLYDGKLRYVLTAVLTPETFGELIRANPVADEWARAIVDPDGTLVARSRSPETIGHASRPSFVAALRRQSEGLHRDRTLEGIPSYLAFAHSRYSEWAVAVVIPAEAVDGPARNWLFAVIGIGLGVFAASGLAALVAARRISNAFGAAAEAAESLARGQRPALPPSSIDEAARLAEAFHRAADLLAQREGERTENLARAQAALSEAEAAARAKDQFLAMLGHELRNPLGPVRSGVHLLGQLSSDDPRFATIRSTVDRQLRHMTRIVDDLLDASRVASGKVVLQREVIDLAQLARDVAADFAPEFVRSAVKLSVEAPAHAAYIHGDRTRLSQCVGNLLHNALKFTPAGGQVTISLTVGDAIADLAVHDTGTGIDPLLLPQLFSPFAQGPQTLSRPSGGLGLGLALVKGFVELHGGVVAARSEGRGKGASFYFRLPLTKLTPGAPPPTSDRPPSTPRRVLIIEDLDDAARTLKMLLVLEGHDVRVAPTGRDALEIAPKFRPEVITCDIGLPDMDGYALCRALRAMPELAETRFIALTGYGQHHDVARSFEAGFDLHFTKPVDVDRFLRAVGESRHAPVAR